jgi:hypothetical protein
MPTHEEHETAKDAKDAEEARGHAVPPPEDPSLVGDPYKPKYHPLELPANPVAAANFPEPGAVDSSVPMSEERQEQAKQAIQAVQEQYHSDLPDEDPRLSGGDPTKKETEDESGAHHRRARK